MSDTTSRQSGSMPGGMVAIILGSKRLQRFAFASFIGALGMLVAFVAFFHYLSKQGLVFTHNSQNQVLARIFANSLDHHGLYEILNPPKHVPPERLRDLPLVYAFDDVILEHIHDLAIAKVKLFNREGVTVYSTDRADIGQTINQNVSFQRSLMGETLGKLIYRQTFNPSDQVFVERDLYESYMPIRGTHNEIIGVFELYADVTASLDNLARQERRMAFGVALLLALSYTVLFILFYRTDRALKREERERESYLRQIETDKGELEQRVAERTAELASAGYFLQSIIDGISEPLRVIGTDLHVTTMNAAARAMVPAGSDPDEQTYCYHAARHLELPCSGPNYPCAYTEVLERRTACKTLHRHAGQDGSRRFVEVMLTPLLDIDGVLVGVIEVEHDVTEVVVARDKLQQSEERIRGVMDTVADAILTVDDEGMIQDANQSAIGYFACPVDELIGLELGALISEETAVASYECDELVEGFLAPAVSQGVQEVMIRRRDGLQVPMELWVGELNFQGSTIYTAVFHDISERRRTEEELEQARRQYFHQEKMAAIGQLAAGILHEVGNPIAAISGALQAISATRDDFNCSDRGCTIDADTSPLLQVIADQVERLSGITREIADFASPRSRQRELLDLNGLIRSTANLMRYDKRFRTVTLNLELDPVLPAVEGIADQLTQVLMNLMINAIDACELAPDRPSEIAIRSRLDGENLYVCVEDNGVGMNDSELQCATDAFYTTKPVGKGTGLGLSLCCSIMATHNGELRIESMPGKGSRVTLRLPLETEAEEMQ